MALDVAIVGGGASGVLVAANLARIAASCAIPPPRVGIIDAGPGPVGAGVAYRTTHVNHVLNVRSSAMSAFPNDPEHFDRWLRETGTYVSVGRFAARRDYRTYLHTILRDHAAVTGQLTTTRDRVVAAAPCADGWRLATAGGSVHLSTHVVLAVGANTPSVRWAPRSLLDSDRFVADPWWPGALDPIRERDRVLLVGTGLTMVDIALSLDRPLQRIHAMSRHGLLPQRHYKWPMPPMPVDVVPIPTPVTLGRLRRWLADRVRQAERVNGDWRQAVDGIRPVTSDLWQALTEADRRAFLREHVRHWDVVRHRMAPGTNTRIEKMRRSGRLALHHGSVGSVADRGDHLVVNPGDAEPLTVEWVINCAGPERDLRATGDPMLTDLFKRNLITAGPCGLGLAADSLGRLTPAGRRHSGLWTLGGTRIGQLWESTAIPEIRVQASQMAGELMRLLSLR